MDATSKGRGTGAHRVFHCGNAALSIVVFAVTLALALVALNPSTSHYLLAARHRTPALDESGAELMAGLIPVMVEVNHSTMLVVPAPTPLSNANSVSRKLSYFFSHPLQVAVQESSTMISEPRASATLSDLVVLLLSKSDGNGAQSYPSSPLPTTAAEDANDSATKSSESRHRNVLHLCSTLSCTSPFVLQQWTNRGTAAAAVHALRRSSTSNTNTSITKSRWRRLHNFALIFGEVERAKTMMRALSEHHVMVSDRETNSNDVVLPLVGIFPEGDVTVSCSPLSWCRYTTAAKQAGVIAALQAETNTLTSPAAKASVFAQWNRVDADAATNLLLRQAVVRQVPLSSLAFNRKYSFHDVCFDLVYADVSGEDSVAMVMFMHSLVNTTKKAMPQNILLVLYPSEWVDEVLSMVDILSTVVHRYVVIPLVSRERAAQLANSTGTENYTDDGFARWRARQHEWLRAAAYTTPFLSHSHTAQTPLLVVLLSQQFSSATELQRALKRATSSSGAEPHASSPLERFLFDALNVTSRDDAEMSVLFDDAEGELDMRASFAGRSQMVLRFVFQYMYFVIPLAVAGALVWSLCRPRRAR